MMKIWMGALALAVALGNAESALALPTFSTFSNLGSFQSALGGAPTSTQDFEGFAAGTDLTITPFLPGVTATSSGTTLEVFNSASIGHVMFGSPRTGAQFHYDLNLGNAYNAIAFDIQAFDPKASAGRLDVVFADASSTSFNVSPGATETTPVFFGILADSNIASIRWNEPLEPLTGRCCEETALDNLVVAHAVPEPASVLALGAGLLGLFGARRLRNG
jgi:hypothetical protein